MYFIMRLYLHYVAPRKSCLEFVGLISGYSWDLTHLPPTPTPLLRVTNTVGKIFLSLTKVRISF